MRSWLFVIFGVLLSLLIISTVIYSQKLPSQLLAKTPETVPEGQGVLSSPSANPSVAPSPGASPPTTSVNTMTTNTHPDLTVDSDGLSKATVIMNTAAGVIKFKFYPTDAPHTVQRIVELINQGFYNGLTFHRVIPGFVIQGGDPLGNGTGGSGQKLPAEFNNRKHLEGSLAMARASDPNSADSQFYISLGVLPHLDHNYTVFGQVIEGMDVAKKIKIGDKMTSVIIQ